MDTIDLTIALLLLLGFGCQWLAWRARLPAILFLLLAGVLLGPVLGLVDPDALLGDLLFPAVSLGVAVILFEGALTLRLEETRGVQGIIRNLVSLGVLVTAGGLAAAAHFLVGLAWPLALLFGALVSVTGPTVIMPLVRSIRPTARIANVLRWEGILIDPIGAILAVLVYDAILSGTRADPLLEFAALVLTGLVVGGAGAGVLTLLLRRHWIPEYLHNFAALALLLTVFSLANLLEHESGLLAVTIMGVMLANTRDLHVEDILDFKEHLTLLLLSSLFLVLGARVDLQVMAEVGWAALALLAVAKLVVRPAAVFLSAIGSNLSVREKLLLSWIAPRGIVAAAVAALFALGLEAKGVPQADLLVPLVFILIIGTVVIESATARPLARLLGLSAADEQGVLIVGANKVALKIAEALQAQGFPALVADTDYEALRQARMKGFRTYFGSVLSEHADRHLDLTGCTRLFAVTRNTELNTLVCSRYRPEFGVKRTFLLLQTKEREQQRSYRGLATALQFPLLFGEETSWAELASRLARGGELRVTKLTNDFGLDDYRAHHGKDLLMLYAIDPEGRLRVFSSLDPFEPKVGWRVCSLVQPAQEPSRVPEGAPPSPRPLPDADQSGAPASA